MRTIYFKATGLSQFKDDTLEIDFRTTKRVRSDIHIDELDTISEKVYLPNTIPFVGKNASGKTMTMSWYYSLANLLSNNAAQTIQSTNYTGTIEVIYVDTIEDEKLLFKTIIELHARSTGGTSVVAERIYKRKLFKSDTRNTIVEFDESDLDYNSKDNPFFDSNSVYTNSYLTKLGTGFSILYSPIYTANLSLQDQFISVFDFQRQLGTVADIQMSSILQLLDEDIDYLKYSGKNNEYFFKRKDQNEVLIPINALATILSAGTLRATCVYFYAFIALQGKTQLVVDEIDLNIHNALAVELINLFQDRKMNPNGATLMFTTHNLDLLNCFSRNDVINIISKNPRINNYKLSEVVERNDSNLCKAKQYLQNVVDSSPSYELKMKMRKQFVK
ncbi:AAA family ATPase [Mollicutes bacterium LVI A0078]|nr:AAA family ATPase [Mollicutes bacterium LVI A0075]WOO90166.1 AAA family ATPase [Mollicutes bacterium LVI A0078]